MSHGSGWCRQHVLDQHFCTISHTIVSAAVTHQVYNWFTSLKRFHISRTLLILFSHRACNACAEAMPIFTFIWKSVHTSTCNFHDFHQTDAFLGHAIFFLHPITFFTVLTCSCVWWPKKDIERSWSRRPTRRVNYHGFGGMGTDTGVTDMQARHWGHFTNRCGSISRQCCSTNLFFTPG